MPVLMQRTTQTDVTTHKSKPWCEVTMSLAEDVARQLVGEHGMVDKVAHAHKYVYTQTFNAARHCNSIRHAQDTKATFLKKLTSKVLLAQNTTDEIGSILTSHPFL
jgi:hypothetical protein